MTDPGKPSARDQASSALAMRKAGMSYRQIARGLKCSTKKAWRLVQRELERTIEQCPEAAREAHALELERLDTLQMAIWNDATSGDVKAVDRVLKIMERRAKLMDLDDTVDVQDAMNRLVDGLTRLRTKVLPAQPPPPLLLEEQPVREPLGTTGDVAGNTPARKTPG